LTKGFKKESLEIVVKIMRVINSGRGGMAEGVQVANGGSNSIHLRLFL